MWQNEISLRERVKNFFSISHSNRESWSELNLIGLKWCRACDRVKPSTTSDAFAEIFWYYFFSNDNFLIENDFSLQRVWDEVFPSFLKNKFLRIIFIWSDMDSSEIHARSKVFIFLKFSRQKINLIRIEDVLALALRTRRTTENENRWAETKLKLILISHNGKKVEKFQQFHLLKFRSWLGNIRNKSSLAPWQLEWNGNECEGRKNVKLISYLFDVVENEMKKNLSGDFGLKFNTSTLSTPSKAP